MSNQSEQTTDDEWYDSMHTFGDCPDCHRECCDTYLSAISDREVCLDCLSAESYDFMW